MYILTYIKGSKFLQTAVYTHAYAYAYAYTHIHAYIHTYIHKEEEENIYKEKGKIRKTSN